MPKNKPAFSIWKRIRDWVLVLLPAVPMVALILRPDEVGLWVKIAFSYPKDIVWLLAFDATMLLPLLLHRAYKMNTARIRVVLYALAELTTTLAYAFFPTRYTWATALILPALILPTESLLILIARDRAANRNRVERESAQ